MLKEIQKDKYFIDGVFLKEFKIFPTGCDPDNLLPIQKEFLIYLAAYSPSFDGLKNWINYELEKKEIEQADFTNKIDVKDEILEVLAKQKDITIIELKNEKAEKLRKESLEQLKEKYGLEEKSEIDVRQEFLKKYHDLATSLAGATKKLNETSKLFERPKELDPKKLDGKT